MPGRGKSAGASSQRKYKELTRSWRRRKWKLFAVLALICVVVGVVTFQAAQRWPSQGWTFGMFAGMFFAGFLILRMSPPGWIENWQVGAWGEESTAKALRVLEDDGWVVMHDLDAAGRGNVDHIAVGPGGVYLLDSKNLFGSVTVDRRGVTVRRLDDPNLSYRHPGSRHLVGSGPGDPPPGAFVEPDQDLGNAGDGAVGGVPSAGRRGPVRLRAGRRAGGVAAVASREVVASPSARGSRGGASRMGVRVVGRGVCAGVVTCGV